MSRLFFFICLLYRSEYCSKEKVVSSFKFQMKCIIIIDIVYLYYAMISSVVRLEVKVVFIVRIFFAIFFIMLRLTFITMNSSCFSLNIKCIYIFVLKFFNLFVFEFSFNLMFNISKGIDIKVFPKLMKNDICSIIVILYFIFTMLMFF